MGDCRGGLGGRVAFVRWRAGGYIMKLDFLLFGVASFCSYLLFVPLHSHGDSTIHDRYGKLDERMDGWTG